MTSKSEREPMPLRPKLTVAAALDYPEASEILVSFPEQWELIDLLKWEGSPLYVAAFPPEAEQPSRDQFHGLSADINRSLTRYRLYRFFQPWVMPSVIVDWDAQAGQGQVVGRGKTSLQLNPIGQAQAWFGRETAVVWECYLHEPQRKEQWQSLLANLWRAVERSLDVRLILTPPHEPTLAEGYVEFLTTLGYAQDVAHPLWWSKRVKR